METIRSLIQTVKKVVDSGLRHEMLGKVTAVQNKLVTTDQQLRAKQAEIDGLRAHLADRGNHAGQREMLVYDPPV